MAFSNIGHSLQDARKEQSLSQDQAAKIIGVDQTTISEWESGRITPRPHQIPALAKFLKIDTDQVKLLRQYDLELRGTGVALPERLILDEAVQKVAEANPRNIQEVAASLQDIINTYYLNGLSQSRQSFLWSLICGGIGFLFLLGVIVFLLIRQPSEVAIASGIAGVVSEIFAAIFLILHQRSSDQLTSYRLGIESTQLFLLANSACEQLDGEAKGKARSEIIQQMILSATETRKQSIIPIHWASPQMLKKDTGK